MSQPQPSILDHSLLDELRQTGGAELVARVASLFEESRATLLETVATAAERSDFVELERAAHLLKSQCGAVGAQRAATACLSLELAGRRRSAEGLGRLVRALEDELTRALRELEVAVRVEGSS